MTRVRITSRQRDATSVGRETRIFVIVRFADGRERVAAAVIPCELRDRRAAAFLVGKHAVVGRGKNAFRGVLVDLHVLGNREGIA